jgi:hypothetical protein
MDLLPSIKRRKREIVDQIQLLSKQKQRFDLIIFLPTLGMGLILSHWYYKSKFNSLEQDFIALSEVEKRLVQNGNFFAHKS